MLLMNYIYLDGIIVTEIALVIYIALGSKVCSKVQFILGIIVHT